jgi:hypothetical protein
MTGFSNKQLKKLCRPVDATHVFKQNRDGKELSYIPGWVAISEANTIFGYSGWDRQTIHLEKLFDRGSHDSTMCGYTARVRIVVRAGKAVITREGTGYGYGVARLATDAHEKALKSAETDATKRALATFGNRFGLSLYRGARTASVPPTMAAQDRPLGLVLIAPDGTVLSIGLSPEAFAGGIRQLIEKTYQADAIENLLHRNSQALSSLKENFPQLISRSGNHYADILQTLAADRKAALAKVGHARHDELPPPVSVAPQTQPSAETTAAPVPSPSMDDDRNKAPANLGDNEPDKPLLPPDPIPNFPRPSRISFGPSVDKSILTYALERRIRNKQHLSHVGAQPCVVCAETPCHAHHVTFAQRRGLAVKVSDEFTVPLCATHHNQLHQAPPERLWWKEQGIDPIATAAKLWEETLRRLTAQSA